MSRKTQMPMNAKLQQIALRNSAIYLPGPIPQPTPLKASTMHCLKQLRRCGFTLTEDTLRAFNALTPEHQGQILDVFNDALGTMLNWNPLVKGWLEPTGEDLIDHLATDYANFLRDRGLWVDGVTLPCGHIIPAGTFNMERYNGCPFCGKPFRTGDDINYGQASKLKELKRWTDADLERTLQQLAASKVPLDGTALENLKDLLAAGVYFDAKADIPIKENAIIIAADLVDRGDDAEAGHLMRSPVDVMRYLWYRHTGHLQLIEPGTIVLNTLLANSDKFRGADTAAQMLAAKAKQQLRLHFGRKTCRMAAGWLNAINMTPAAACAAMHPKRGMWTRFIRALRLAEYARKPGYERLAALLRTWWDQAYAVPQGIIDTANRRADMQAALAELKRHPGMFSRQLFSTILMYGSADVLQAFRSVLTQVPVRLVISLGNNADLYFRDTDRVVVTLTRKVRYIGPNQRIADCSEQQRKHIVKQIQDLFVDRLKQHYAEHPEPGTKIYIDPILDSMVLPVGDRSDTVQAFSSALQGTRFPLLGERVRLFLNWGEGMAAAPIDLDISAKIVYPDHVEDCAYYNLAPDGAYHSGDIRQIPDKVGTAEYIELDVPVLRANGAKYVIFIASHYSGGTLNVNTRVGWMDSAYPMTVSDETGVAYDPSTVQQMVKVAPTSMARSLTFGMLDIDANEIVWLELGSDSQAAFEVSADGVLAMLEGLKQKTTVGKALRMMADARDMVVVDNPADADRSYTRDWALDVPQVVETLL